MATITDEYRREMMTKTKAYSIDILNAGPNTNRPDLQQIIWEHVRRNFSLRAEGLLSILFPVRDGSEINGIGIFNVDESETKNIMEGDPGVLPGVFVYEIHPTRSFPGDKLPS